ncbi:MAG: hypothetical protein FJ405_18815, partial [Verrucomicrobia bacterium]|nr:hypothetical protein [Verrucomicrobiota bacterium]
MPIRLNLLREHHAAEEARRKDPVKRGILAGSTLVACVLCWSLVLQFQLIRTNSELGSIQSRWQAIEVAYKKAVDNRRMAIDAESKLVALQRFTTNRFLWGSA